MFFKNRINKRAQTTSEYAVLVAVIIAAMAGMQIYLRRGIQARLKNAADYPLSSVAFSTSQYEPEYVYTQKKESSDYKSEEEMKAGAAISRATTEVISSNTTSIIGDL